MHRNEKVWLFHKNKSNSRIWIWDSGLVRKRLNINHLKYTLRAKESHVQRIKRNQENDIQTQWQTPIDRNYKKKWTRDSAPEKYNKMKNSLEESIDDLSREKKESWT